MSVATDAPIRIRLPRPRAAAPGPLAEQSLSFDCFGSRCTVAVGDARRLAQAEEAVQAAREQLLAWHERFSRFLPGSEVNDLNDDPRARVPVSPLMRRLVQAAVFAARRSGGLVDPTMVTEIEQAGYDRHFAGRGLPLREALALAPPRRPGHPRTERAWRAIEVDRHRGTVRRPPGLKLDVGGIAKGVFADELAAVLRSFDAFVVDCGGDLRLGGAAGLRRDVHVASPFDSSTLHTWTLAAGAAATSGIGKRSWFDADGRPAHHLLDPGSGRPAFTGIVQATALAPSAAEAEIYSKAAVLSGPERAPQWLSHGGVLVFDDGSYRVFDGVDSAHGTMTASS